MPRQRLNRAALRHALVIPVGLVLGTFAIEARARAMASETVPWWLDRPADASTATSPRILHSGFDLDVAAPTDDHPYDLAPDRQHHAAVIDTNQALFFDPGSGERLSFHGRFGHDDAGRTSSDLGLRYRHRFHDRPVQFGLSGGLRDESPTDSAQRSVGAEFRAAPLELRAHLIDDVTDERSADGSRADRLLDAYDVEVGARVPFLPWAWLKANRFWKITTDGEDAEVADSFSLRLAPLTPLEIETGSTDDGGERSWFARLRLRLRLGDPR